MLASKVADKLQQQWSPQQFAGWLMRTYPNDAICQVPHEKIYRTPFIQSRGALKKELLEHLRRTRAMRRSRHHTQKTLDHGRISERRADVEDRAVPDAQARRDLPRQLRLVSRVPAYVRQMLRRMTM